jgi:hypothetical protein
MHTSATTVTVDIRKAGICQHTYILESEARGARVAGAQAPTRGRLSG